MRAYGVIEPNVPGWMEVEKPALGYLDALLKPLLVAPCSSDTHIMHGGSGPICNTVLGHEAVGEIVEVGAGVKHFKPGDVVVIPCTTPDWESAVLQEKGSNNAHDGYGFASSFKFILSRPGVFAELFTVNNADANLVLLPSGVTREQALMCADMMSTGIYGAEMANIKLGDTVVVFGIGPVGLMAVAGARLLGAGRIIAIGTRPNCVELAKEYGATNIVSYKDGDVVEQIQAIAGGKVDSYIIAGGNCATMNQALSVIKFNGTISNVNNVDISDSYQIPALLMGLGMADVTLRNGFCPGGAYRMQKMLALVEAGRVDPSKLLNYRYEGFEKIEEAFRTMDEKPRDLIKPYVIIEA